MTVRSSLDCSLYCDAPLAVQIANVYRNRAIGYYYQSKGAYVIKYHFEAGMAAMMETLEPEIVLDYTISLSEEDEDALEKEADTLVQTYGWSTCIPSSDRV